MLQGLELWYRYKIYIDRIMCNGTDVFVKRFIFDGAFLNGIGKTPFHLYHHRMIFGFRFCNYSSY